MKRLRHLRDTCILWFMLLVGSAIAMLVLWPVIAIGGIMLLSFLMQCLGFGKPFQLQDW